MEGASLVEGEEGRGGAGGGAKDGDSDFCIIIMHNVIIFVAELFRVILTFDPRWRGVR